ncbi:hypothetical protein ABPG74_010622 [Tetrahymena malaccensis]
MQKQSSLKTNLLFRDKKNVEESDDRYILNNYKLKRKNITKPGQKLNELGQNNLQQNLLLNSNSQACQDNILKKQFTQPNYRFNSKLQNQSDNNSLYSFKQYTRLPIFQPSQKSNQQADSQLNQNNNKFSQLETTKTVSKNIQIQQINELWMKNYGINQLRDKENIQNKQQVKSFPRQKNNLFLKEKHKVFSQGNKFQNKNNPSKYQQSQKINKYGGTIKQKSFQDENFNYEKLSENQSISDSKSDNYDDNIKQKRSSFVGGGQPKFNDEKQTNYLQQLNDCSEKVAIKQQNQIYLEEKQQNGEKQMQEQFDLIRNSFQQNKFASQIITEKQTPVSNLLESLGNLKEIFNYFYSYQNIHKISKEVFEKVFLLNLKKKKANIIPIEIKTGQCGVIIINHGEAIKIDVPKVLPYLNSVLDPRKKKLKFNCL